MDSPTRSSTLPPTQPRLGIPEMPPKISTIPDDPTTTAAAAAAVPSSLFDWSDFLDFGLDDPFAAISFDTDQQQEKAIAPAEPEPVLAQEDDAGRTRKRDPRLVCSNFLSGRIPCACPELDEQLEQEEMALGGPGKKRARTVRLRAGSTARCQVPDCEADISELKGYHRRHRVCLRCANASAVVLDGQSKRYCQQCGKFHTLSDFDEGKRSCRRKLERHNNRRRRKPTGGKGIEKEAQEATLSEDVSCDDDTGKDSVCLSSQIAEREIFLESEGQLSTLCSAHDSQNIQTDTTASFATFDETRIEGEKEVPKHRHSPSYCENKSAFSSVCPTGRISFKLYDWNPAEFPRRLRNQIFQWLASMPVELEGYIRPGCTILTVFIAMPKFMWIELSEEPAAHLHDFVISPGNILSGRGTFFAYLNDMLFGVMKDGTSVMKVKVKEHIPQLHYVHPLCFEAGKPMEFVACGSNLLQPKLRCLVSFAGKYLAYDVCVSSSCRKNEGDASSLNHQLLKISVPQTEPNLFGPAFFEVENESGLSNFIPVLIADKETCAEVKIIQQIFDAPLFSKRPEFAATSSSCQVSASRQTESSGFITDVAWLLKKPDWETMQRLTLIQIKRINNLLNFLIKYESTAILDRVLYYVRILVDNNLNASIADADMELLRITMDNARGVLSQKFQGKGSLVTQSNKLLLGEISLRQSSQNDLLFAVPPTNQDVGGTHKPLLEARVGLTSVESSATVPLLKGEVVMGVNVKERATKSCSPFLTKILFTYRSLIFVVTAATVCFGVCAAFLHPQKVGQLATTIRRCLLENS